MFGVGHVHVADDVHDAAVGLFGQAFVLAAVARFHVENRIIGKGEDSPSLPSSVSWTKVPEPAEGPLSTLAGPQTPAPQRHRLNFFAKKEPTGVAGGSSYAGPALGY